MTDVVVRGLVRETIDTSTGELRVQGLVREVFVPAAAVARQYAVTLT